MNFNDSKSIYQQIATRICDEIMLGVYEEGNRIPSVRDYASQMEVNANTAVRSYGYLEQLGIIESKRGLGYFVTPDSREIITEARKKEFARFLQTHGHARNRLRRYRKAIRRI